MRLTTPIVLTVLTLTLAGCGGDAPEEPDAAEPGSMAARVAWYAPVRLTTDLDVLTDAERAMIPLLIDAAKSMDAIFWMEAYGDREALLASIEDPDTRRFAEINYGPWDRLQGDAPFLEMFGEKPKGAQFYPRDMTVEEFEAAAAAAADGGEALRGLYSVVVRDAAGGLTTVPYHEAFEEPTLAAAAKLDEAAELAEDPGLRRYLELRADALRTDEYFESDMAWMDMKNNVLDIVVGPIETYEDKLFNYRAAHEAYVLVKDRAWSERLARYAELLPALQRGLPVPDAYKQEEPGSDSDLNAYDVIYYAGDCNAGSKTIAINLPNDERVQLAKGARRLQLKNAMRAKFDKILVPIADTLIDPAQRGHITFDAFFSNIMFHEVAHGLGIKNTIDGAGTVRDAMRDRTGPLEEAKADILGLYMVTELQKRGELGDVDLMDNYVTFLAGIVRSIRFGASSAHGRGNLAQFGFFEKNGAFTFDAAAGTYRVEFEAMQKAVEALAGKILTIQGDGDYEAAAVFLPDGAKPAGALADSLARLMSEGIPKDVVFEQGMAVLEAGS